MFEVLAPIRFRKHGTNNVRFAVFTAVTMKNGVFWDMKRQFVLHRRRIRSPLESSQLMLCKICSFHGVDYEERRLRGCYALWLL
jgi:hypothetical protein